MKKIICTSLLILVAGCASRPQFVSAPSVETNVKETIVKLPSLNSATEISVGESLYSEVIKVDEQEFNVKLMGSGKSTLDNGYSVSVNEGQHGKLYSLKNQYQAYCSGVVAKSSALDVLGGSSKACLVDFDNDGKFEKAMFASYDRYFPLLPQVPYVKTPRTLITSIKTEKFRREAIFQGVTNNVIRVMFREFYDNKIRTAFTQNIGYELNEKGEAVIVFKGFKAIVHKANGTNLTYSVVAPFKPS